MTTQKVVIVEDEKSPLMVLRKALKDAGADVAVCTTAFDGLDEIASSGADAAVISEKLPDLSGLQLANLLKSDNVTSGMPIVVVHSENGDGDLHRFSLADELVARKVVEQDENKVVAKIQALVKASKDAGWRGGELKNHPFVEAGFSGSNLIKSYGTLVDMLLMERTIEHFARTLLDSMTSRVEFMTRYFTFLDKIFAADATGLVVADPQGPWGIYQIKGSVSKSSFEKLCSQVTKSVEVRTEPRLILNGELAEKGGSAIKTSEIIPVVGEKQEVLGALVVGWTSKQSLDDHSQRASEHLKLHLQPVFRTLFDKQEIQIVRQREAYWSSTDPVTGLYNLEFLVGFLQQQLLFSFRQKLPVGLIIVDIDRFLELNQSFGTQVGDLVLRTLAERLSASVRSSDLVARYGGDQFAIVLPNTDITGSQTLAEKLRSEIETMKWERVSGKAPKVTISVGCAAFNMNDLNPETILRDAKMALMNAKQNGRNRVAV